MRVVAGLKIRTNGFYTAPDSTEEQMSQTFEEMLDEAIRQSIRAKFNGIIHEDELEILFVQTKPRLIKQLVNLILGE